MDLVVGATGMLGSEICRRLRAAGRRVRGLVRATSSPERVGSLKAQGVEIFAGDLKDRASIDAACRGAGAVVSTASATVSRQAGDTLASVDLEGQLDLVDSARAAGVGQFVYVSYSKNIDDDSPLTVAKRSVERRIRESGMTRTILRPSCFMEVWLGPALGFDIANGRVRIYGSGERPISWVSFLDVAGFAAESLTNPLARDATIELGGPEALSPLEVVRICEEAGGRRFEVEHVPEAALEAQKVSATDPLQKTFASLMLACARGNAIDMRETLRAFPVRLRSVRDHVRSVLGG